MHDGVAVTVDRDRLGRMIGRAARRRPAVIVGMVVVGIRVTGTVRHRHSRAGREGSSVRRNLRADLTLSWLIFQKGDWSNQMARTAASTSSAWPSTRTWRQILTIRRSAPIKTVVRMIPMKFLPYIDFSPQAP